MAKGYTLPTNREYEDTVKYLLWNQFPVMLDSAIRYFAALPQTGRYRQVNAGIRNFKKALLETAGRDLTLSGVGSLIDYQKFGHQIKRPTPQLAGSGCNGNSLCLDPVCFGFTEGLIESNNLIQKLCWQLMMPCLKDGFYSDSQFERKVKQYIAMFMAQPAVVLEAYQRTRLLAESIKVVCLDKNIRWTGSVIGGNQGIPLPFYINPSDPYALPDLDTLPANIGGANLHAFSNHVAPRLFSGAFSGGIEGVRVYGLSQDKATAMEQTASVMDGYFGQETLRALALLQRGSDNQFESLIGQFVHDGLFPTLFANEDTNVLEYTTAEILEPSTIAGYQMTDNPQHALNKYRGLLFVPDNWMFDLIEPEKDDFSDLGFSALNFATNTPGVFPVMSSSMFARNTLGPDGVVQIGQGIGENGMLRRTVTGIQARPAALTEAVRTEIQLTWSRETCGQVTDGQLPVVGPKSIPQGKADGFALKSTMNIGTAVKGQAKPVLLLFQTDTPRSAVPIVVCNTVDVEVSTSEPLYVVSCSPGDATYAVLTFNKAVGSAFAVNNLAILRTGAKGDTYLVKVTVVSGNTVTVIAVDAAGTAAPSVILPCCSGSPDDYGSRVELTKTTGATALTSEIFKAEYDADDETFQIETFLPLAAATADDTGTITLANGDVIEFKFSANKPVGVFSTIEVGDEETCDFADIDCSCLLNAVFTMDEGT